MFRIVANTNEWHDIYLSEQSEKGENIGNVAVSDFDEFGRCDGYVLSVLYATIGRLGREQGIYMIGTSAEQTMVLSNYVCRVCGDDLVAYVKTDKVTERAECRGRIVEACVDIENDFSKLVNGIVQRTGSKGTARRHYSRASVERVVVSVCLFFAVGLSLYSAALFFEKNSSKSDYKNIMSLIQERDHKLSRVVEEIERIGAHTRNMESELKQLVDDAGENEKRDNNTEVCVYKEDLETIKQAVSSIEDKLEQGVHDTKQLHILLYLKRLLEVRE
jgi:hypothetical protein